MIPSIKTITDRLELNRYVDNTRDAARAIRRLMESANTNSAIEDAMIEIEKLLGNHGVEPLRGNWVNNYWCDCQAIYSNTGDTYAPTVIYDVIRRRFIVCSWGDLVEGNPRRFPN